MEIGEHCARYGGYSEKNSENGGGATFFLVFFDGNVFRQIGVAVDYLFFYDGISVDTTEHRIEAVALSDISVVIVRLKFLVGDKSVVFRFGGLCLYVLFCDLLLFFLSSGHFSLLPYAENGVYIYIILIINLYVNIFRRFFMEKGVDISGCFTP